jgi:molybdate transport system regulatory protein
MTKLSIRVDFGDGVQIGPGKIALLEFIASQGSILQAGKAMGMSYRRAWLLVQDLNEALPQASVISQTGGARGGGAELTPFGKALVSRYRKMEQAANKIAAREFTGLGALRKK